MRDQMGGASNGCRLGTGGKASRRFGATSHAETSRVLRLQIKAEAGIEAD
jgi:hypothetical protein